MAKQEQVIKIVVDTGSAKGQLGGLNKNIKSTGKQGVATGGALATTFGAVKTAILGAIPALRAFTMALVSTGVGALVVAVGALVGVVAKAANKGKEFQKATASLGAISGATADEMEALTDQAKELGSTTIFTASQVVSLQTELAKLGFSAYDISNATPAILDMAAALDVGLAESAAFAGSMVNAFGLETEDTQRVVDVMAASAVNSAQDFNTLRSSFENVAPSARALGITVEETAGMLGALADNSITGGKAGTSLNRAFIQLAKDGIPLEEALDKIRNSTDGLTTATELAGSVGGKSLLILANEGEKVANLTETFENASGAAKDLAEQRFDTLEGDTLALGSAWEGFLLNIEDGNGIINKIQRFAVQALTKGIQILTEVISFVGFAFTDRFRSMKEIGKGTVDILVGAFQYMGAQIKKFSNQILIQIARIPIIGSAIDVAAARKRVNEAASAIDDAEKKIRDGRDRIANEAMMQRTFFARYAKEQEGKAIAQQERKNQEVLDEIAEEQAKKDEEDRKKAEKQREDHLKKLANIEKKYLQAGEDLEDKTALEKAQRKRERAQAELDALVLSEEEKRTAQLALNKYFDDLEKESAQADKDKEDAEKEKQKEKDAKELKEKQDKRIEEFELDKEFEALQFEERRLILQERRQALLDDELLSEEQKAEILKELNQQEQKLDQDKVASKQMALDAVIGLAGAETKVGQALLIAKQVLQMKEMIMDLKNLTFKGKKAIGETMVDSAQNVSKSAKIGFPQNIITIAAAIGQGISIMNSVKKAVSKTGAPVGGGSNVSPPPTVAPAEATTGPAFNVIGGSGINQLGEALGNQNNRPIKTYVVANDVTTEQALERNIVNQASI